MATAHALATWLVRALFLGVVALLLGAVALGLWVAQVTPSQVTERLSSPRVAGIAGFLGLTSLASIIGGYHKARRLLTDRIGKTIIGR